MDSSPSTRQTLVVLGGTFNPVHLGHLIIARHVAERLDARRVLLMPAAAPPHKGPPSASPEDRLSMLHQAVADDPLFEISTLEVDRPGPSYTYDTLTALRRLHGLDTRLVWVIGLDMLLELHKWHRATEVVDMATIVTAVRPPMPLDLDERLRPLRKHLGEGRAARLVGNILDTPLIEISSSTIRDRVRLGRSIRYLTPDCVVKYISGRGLYRLADSAGF